MILFNNIPFTAQFTINRRNLCIKYLTNILFILLNETFALLDFEKDKYCEKQNKRIFRRILIF